MPPLNADGTLFVEEEKGAPVDELSRMGQFLLRAELVLQRPDLAAGVLAELRFVPHMVQLNEQAGAFLYFGHSLRFDLLSQGERVPAYQVSARVCDDAGMVVSVERVEDGPRLVVPK